MPRLLVLSHADVETLLPVDACIAVMAKALSDLDRGRSYQPLRVLFRPPDANGFIGLMPAQTNAPVLKFVEGPAGGSAFGIKALCVVPDNPTRGLDSHQGGVLLHDGTTGELLAVMNASAITSIRTAAVSALATRSLARRDAGDLALIGTGVQARAHLEAISRVRDLRRVRVTAKTIENAKTFAAEQQHRVSVPIEAVAGVEAAVRDADIIVTATNASTPILQGRWIKDGAHLNLVGACFKSAREVDAATIARGTIFVDRRESALNESGDILIAMSEGAIPHDHLLTELGEVLTGSHAGRTSADEITVFKSLGLAIEDLAAAAYLYCEASVRQTGQWLEF